MIADLVIRLQAQSDALTSRVLEEMYQDPFWTARFGERGRQFARQDGAFHLSYLIQALVAQDPHVLVNYARWLQSVLTTRGMCSRHLEENFERLSRAIADTVEGSVQACECLAQAQRALHYPNGPGREVQARELALAEAAARECTMSTREVRVLFSYLADALALDRPSTFVAHAEWLSTHADRVELDDGAPARALRAMQQAVRTDRQLTEPTRMQAIAVLEVVSAMRETDAATPSVE